MGFFLFFHYNISSWDLGFTHANISGVRAAIGGVRVSQLVKNNSKPVSDRFTESEFFLYRFKFGLISINWMFILGISKLTFAKAKENAF